MWYVLEGTWLYPSHLVNLGCPMGAASTSEITQLLIAWNQGDAVAFEQLTPLVHTELHRLAKRYMAGERPGHILQTTALVNEAYLRLIDWKNVQWQNRAHFFGLAAQIMRHILVDFARAQRREKRGGGALRVSLSAAADIAQEQSADLVALDDALQMLEQLDPRQARVVELRFFAGLSLEETAEALKVSVGTVSRDWSLAIAWLYRELSKGAVPDCGRALCRVESRARGDRRAQPRNNSDDGEVE
jgi:RNA polymerase sigma factor (TIGR02999 family)